MAVEKNVDGSDGRFPYFVCVTAVGQMLRVDELLDFIEFIDWSFDTSECFQIPSPIT